jgi:site-specific DNA-cytosine methylase
VVSRVLGDLAALGYDAEWHCIPAAAVGAPHIRDRVFIVAYTASIRVEKSTRQDRQSNGGGVISGGMDAIRTGAVPYADRASLGRFTESRGSTWSVAA